MHTTSMMIRVLRMQRGAYNATKSVDLSAGQAAIWRLCQGIETRVASVLDPCAGVVRERVPWGRSLWQ